VTQQKPNRALAEQAGRRAETYAALALQLKGYVILARRAKNPRGEVDLIARRGKILAFIEVKMRRTRTDPANILTTRQMARIVNGATGWAAARAWTAKCQWRYDLVLVTPWRWPRHIRDAWRPQNDPTLERQHKGGNVRAMANGFHQKGRS
jgi:putative endonuclease